MYIIKANAKPIANGLPVNKIIKRKKKRVIQNGRSCMDFKGLIFEDVIDNKGKTKSIQEYREIIKDLREDKKYARNFSFFESLFPLFDPTFALTVVEKLPKFLS